VDVSFDKLTDHLDASFSLGLEARKGRFGLYTSAGYMKFSADTEGPRGAEADFELKILIADACSQGEVCPALDALAREHRALLYPGI
jgi:hypothetical protein